MKRLFILFCVLLVVFLVVSCSTNNQIKEVIFDTNYVAKTYGGGGNIVQESYGEIVFVYDGKEYRFGVGGGNSGDAGKYANDEFKEKHGPTITINGTYNTSSQELIRFNVIDSDYYYDQN